MTTEFDNTITGPGQGLFLWGQLTGNEPTYCVLLPSYNINEADAGTIAAHETSISGGDRPTSIALTWLERKGAHDHPETRVLVGVLLDGHHKVLAYARQDVPARILLICRIEDSWSPQGNRALGILETVAPIKVKSP